MFCPRCGNPEQRPESYCRHCGLFLPDLSKVKPELPPEDHLAANAVLSALTIAASFTLSTLLFAMLGFRADTHPLVYCTAGLLIGIGAWHIQSLIRTQKLKKQWKRRAPLAETKSPLPETAPALASASTTGKLLEPADLSGAIPASVTEDTTRHLAERPRPKVS